MANYSTLKAAVNQYIKTNGNKEITGPVLNSVLTAMIDSLGANYTFAGIATPSTNPGTPDQNVFYFAMHGGTYTNFGATALPEGISLLLWNGSWTAQTIMYNDGGVFDISVYKSTGGTLATFSDLSAALGTGGANIPVAARKGGMSIRFVQTSDNKYVRYNLLAQSFTTDTSQWAIDDGDVYVEDTEYVEIKTDAEEKILEGIKIDGTKYIAGNLKVGGDIINKGLDLKVDKVAGKSLINSEFASSQSVVEDTEFIEIKADNANKILEAITVDGTKRVFGNLEVDKFTIKEPGKSIFANEIKRNIVNREILNLNPKENILPVLENLKFQYGMWGGIEMAYKRLTFLWFTDIHHDNDNVKRIREFYDEYQDYIDDVITTGDLVRSDVLEDDFSWWEKCGGSKFLLALGNHDTQDNNGIVSPKYCYDRYIKNYAAQWGVSFETNKNYWYKDYVVRDAQDPTYSESPVAIRLICIDQYHWKERDNFSSGNWNSNGVYPDGTSVDNGEQEQWFVNKLNEAANLDYAVIVMLHSPTNDIVPIPCTFHTLDQAILGTGTGAITADMKEDVQNFISEQNGTFIAWITGHLHQDWFGTITDYPQQLLISIGHDGHTIGWKFDEMVEGTKSQDRFNLLSIEPLEGYLRMFRVGLEYDRHGRHIGSLAYNYKNRNLIYNY